MDSAELKAILDELKQRLSDLYGDRLVELVLYGSQARGDADEGSDIDVLVVLSGAVNPCAELRSAGDILYDISYDNDTVVSCVFVPEAEFARGEGPLIRNVHREGVRL